MNTQLCFWIDGEYIYLSIKVRPGSKIESVSKNSRGQYVINLKAKPVLGKANQALVAFLANWFSVPIKDLKIIKGLKSSTKLIRVCNCSTVRQRLDQIQTS